MKRFDMYVDEVMESPNGAWVRAVDAMAILDEHVRLEEAAVDARCVADGYGLRLTAAESRERKLQLENERLRFELLESFQENRELRRENSALVMKYVL